MTDTPTAPAPEDAGKPWYQSQTVMSALTAIVGVGAALFGYQFVGGDAAAQELVKVGGEVAALVATVYAIIGRFKAGGIFIRTPK